MKRILIIITIMAALLSAALLSACSPEKTGPQTRTYTLESQLGAAGMHFIGVGGSINGKTDPELKANAGDTLEVTLISAEGVEHNIIFPDFNAQSANVKGKGERTTLTFLVDRPGSFSYECNIPGHKDAGMLGKLEVGGTALPRSLRVTWPPARPGLPELPQQQQLQPPAAPMWCATRRSCRRRSFGTGPGNVRIDLTAEEVVGQLADGTTFTYWTFNSKVAGPFFRVRLGDTVEVHMKNNLSSSMAHSVDFHAVTGPGGSAVATQTNPGEETMFAFKAINVGLYVYHCATPMVAHHITNGMYGLILVEPEGGLPAVDREFYVMQGEIYTNGKFGEPGAMTTDITKLLDEDAEYLVFNGAAGGLTAQKPLKANVGETVQIFFGVGGPGYTSSFHVIGEIFDRVYDQASLTGVPLTDVQTTLVPPGGATMVEFKLEVPGRYILVDHALSRLQRGLAGYLLVDGPAAPDIFQATPAAGSGH